MVTSQKSKQHSFPFSNEKMSVWLLIFQCVSRNRVIKSCPQYIVFRAWVNLLLLKIWLQDCPNDLYIDGLIMIFIMYLAGNFLEFSPDTNKLTKRTKTCLTLTKMFAKFVLNTSTTTRLSLVIAQNLLLMQRSFKNSLPHPNIFHFLHHFH